MISNNLIKEFDINVIASFVENRVLVIIDKNYTDKEIKKVIDKFTTDFFEFCSFITGVNINFSNINLYAITIKDLLIKQYPSMNYRLLCNELENVDEEQIINAIMKYKELYGDTIIIKTSEQQIEKVLKKTRK